MVDWGHGVPEPITELVAALVRHEPRAKVQRLQVSYDADDDNLWFVALADAEATGWYPNVQFECHPSGLPVLIEGPGDERVEAHSVEEALTALLLALGNS